jgi:hypothetical protein
MRQLKPSSQPLSLPHRQTLVLALLLLTAQLFAQLHALEHLNALHDSQHADEVCPLCILGSDLHAFDAEAIDCTLENHKRSESVKNGYLFFAIFPFIAFIGRAPPGFSAFT